MIPPLYFEPIFKPYFGVLAPPKRRASSWKRLALRVNGAYNSLMPLTVYVDVDDTLVRTTSGTIIPIPGVVAHVRHLHEQGAQIYCWSAGGDAYARQIAERLGIADCFTAFLPKPHLLLDDQQPTEWPGFVVQHLSSCSGSPDYSALLNRHSQ